ncbi:MAG: hypothetical protein V2B20_15480 [Pseudomonadota bacterium]
MKPTETQSAAYQKIFDYFNRRLFENSLSNCMLSFSRRRISSHTLFSSGQWCEKAGSAIPQISLNFQQLKEGEPIELMAMLVAQMVHLWQEQYGKPSRKGYFNREWAEKMEEIGLIPSSTGLPGGKRIGQGIKHYIEDNDLFEKAFREMPTDFLLPFRPEAFKGKIRGGFSVKEMYRCISCGTKVWGKSGLGIMCECGEVFVGETKGRKAGVDEKIYEILGKRFG